MKTVAIMQPYLFPYIGYFNLIDACSLFISLDDAQHIRRGWVNRNRFGSPDNPVYFTVPLRKTSRESAINKQYPAFPEYSAFLGRTKKQMKAFYGKAPYYDDIVAMVLSVLSEPADNLARLAEQSIRAVLSHIGITREILPASSLPDDIRGEGLAGQERIIHIAKGLNAGVYANPPGGRDLYDEEAFATAGMKLRFIEPLSLARRKPDYHITPLSIIDLLMHNSPETVRGMVHDHSSTTNPVHGQNRQDFIHEVKK